MELLLGCGSNRQKKLFLGNETEWKKLVTLDINPALRPDIVWDLSSNLQLPFDDNTFDEIHAYDVLEHCGRQGDWRFFFRQWSDFYRLLKPHGMFFGISPAWDSPWAWGDPGHTRIIGIECLTFLRQPEYAEQCGKSAMTDYRFVWEGDFDIMHSKSAGGHFEYALRAVKPTRFVRARP